MPEGEIFQINDVSAFPAIDKYKVWLDESRTVTKSLIQLIIDKHSISYHIGSFYLNYPYNSKLHMIACHGTGSVYIVNWVTYFVNIVKSHLLTVNKVYWTLLSNLRLPTATLCSSDIEQLLVLDWQYSVQDISLGGLSMMSVRIV